MGDTFAASSDRGLEMFSVMVERSAAAIVELAGVRVYNPEKVGKDAGELFGGQLTGVVTTDDSDQILGIDADCVCYNPLGTTLGSQSQPLDDICRLLASGKNVVSSAVEYYGYLHPEVGPRRAGAEAAERINAACDEGPTSMACAPAKC